MSYYDIDCGCNQATGSQNSVCTIEGDTFYIESSVGVGLSAYEIAVNDGFTGTEEQWLESLKVSGSAIITGLDDLFVNTTLAGILREIGERLNSL